MFTKLHRESFSESGNKLVAMIPFSLILLAGRSHLTLFTEVFFFIVLQCAPNRFSET